MFARAKWGRLSPDRIDDLAVALRPSIDALSQLEGYQGVALLANRESGEVEVVTYWDTAETMAASEETASAARSSVLAAAPGLQVKEVDRMEFVIRERLAPPRSGTFLRVTDLNAAVDKVDDTVAFVRDQVVPVLKGQPGLQSILMLANRATGRMIAASIWNSAAERDASGPAVDALREQAGNVARAENTSVRTYESILVEIKLPTPA